MIDKQYLEDVEKDIKEVKEMMKTDESCLLDAKLEDLELLRINIIEGKEN